MSRKRRHKAKRLKVTATGAPAAEATKVHHPYGAREVRRDILVGVFFIVIVLGVKHLIEHSTFGEQMKVMGYNFLQTQLSSDGAPVTIVDITKLPSQDSVRGETVLATPRKPLEQMIAAIAEHEPRAIGVDIDFSPVENVYVHPDDPQFFQFCLDLQETKGVPVFLGINRTIANPASDWLGGKTFEPLAANILIPKDSKRMLNVLQVGDGKVKGYQPSRSMSALLADAYGEGETSGVGQWIHELLAHFHLIKKFSKESNESDLSVQDFLVDYGPLHSLEEKRIKIDPKDLKGLSNRERFAGNIVLIGDATLGEAADTFVVPAREEPVPGIFLHACAAYTLIKAPLYALTDGGRIVLDVFLSAIILLGVVLIKYRYKDAEQRHGAAEKWRGRLTLLIVLAAVVVGVVFVRITRIMWDDFFLALLLLVFHPSIEHHVETLWTKIKRVFRSKDRLTTESATSMKLSCWPLILIAFVILNCSSGVNAQEHPAAIIESISGVVLLQHDGRQTTLNPKTDIARRLYAGDRIRCTKGAKATLWIGKDKKTDLKENLSWFVVPSTRSLPSDVAQKAIREYGRIGGRTRHVDGKSIVFSPPDESVVAPESFIIRWVPVRKKCVTTLEIRQPGAEVLWEEKNVNSASGELNSEAARKALESYRSETGVGTLRLKLNDSCGNTAQSDFTLLSTAEENSLKEELKVWDSEDGSLLKHLGRAAVFNNYRMFSNVADEYEQALALAPQSRDLLLRTIEAQNFIGNSVRVKELELRRAGRD